MTKLTKTERREQENAQRVKRVNLLRTWVLGDLETETGTLLIKQKKQLAMDAYHFYLGLEKQNREDDDQPPLTKLPQLEKPVKPVPLDVPEIGHPIPKENVEPELVECPNCEGTGTDESDGMQCTVCFGEGLIEVEK